MIQRVAYTLLKRHFIGIRLFRLGVQMAVIEGHFRILLMNFTTSELIFLCKSKSKKGFMFSPLLVSAILPESLLLLLYHVPAEKATGFAAFLNVGD